MNDELFIGVDTSCYTTSVSCVNASGSVIADNRCVLSVKKGMNGLRQNDAVFQHVRNLSEISDKTLRDIDTSKIKAVGVSECPGGRVDSYMPVFLAGKTVANSIAASLHVPVFYFTHQQGHMRAALKGNEQLANEDFFAFHLSGGTTELLKVDASFNMTKIGGSSDINAGQLVDRVGVKMGLSFPTGKFLEELASKVENENSAYKLPSSVRQLTCSFSGVETKARSMLDSGAPHEQIAMAIYDCISRTLSKMILYAMTEYGENRFLFAGGVSSSSILRKKLEIKLSSSDARLWFSDPKLASDNAVGVALLAKDSFFNK